MTREQEWREWNERDLAARIRRVRDALVRVLRPEPAGDEPATASAPEPERPPALTRPATVEAIGEAFRLSPFESSVLVLCAGAELDPEIRALCAVANGHRDRGHATFALALAVLPQPHWSALAPPGPLRRWRLVELGDGGLAEAPLRIDERILHYLTGTGFLDARLQPLLRRPRPPAARPRSLRVQRERIQTAWQSPAGPTPVVELTGADLEGQRELAAQACADMGIDLYLIRGQDVPASALERDLFCRLWEREAALLASGLLVDCGEEGVTPAVKALSETLGAPLMIQGLLGEIGRPVLRVEVNRPTTAEQAQLWREGLGATAARLDGHLDVVVGQFDLGACAIEAACQSARAEVETGADPAAAVSRACRARARAPLDGLAQRLDPRAKWEDLVLPPPPLHALRAIVAQVRRRRQVYESWGFAERLGSGLGVSALFAGEAGTGKTLAAEVVARELDLDLYRIDLSQVMSKFIGETEKNLRRVFDAAEESGAILLFDEADALFARRTNVNDSHDRYANIEVSYLLQRMEGYRGLAVLTTNMKSAVDEAFQRRLRFVVEFPFPDAAHRAQIWQRIFPAATPTDGLDVEKLARLRVPGGAIRNIALNAAFMAAEAGESVRMAHVHQAAQVEYAKHDRALTEAEAGGWA